MAQYDIIFVVNDAASGVTFGEITIPKPAGSNYGLTQNPTTGAISWAAFEPAFSKNNAFNKNFGTASGTICQGNDTRLSNARPASDVYAWAKSTTKPSYTYTEVGAAAASHTHNVEDIDDLGNIGGYSVVATLPATIASGVQVLYNGTLWRGLIEGESSLAAGTPWPVKGYKEANILLNYVETGRAIEAVLIDTIGIASITRIDGYQTKLITSQNYPAHRYSIISNPVTDVNSALLILYQSQNIFSVHPDEIYLLNNIGDPEISLPVSVQIKIYPPDPA